MKKSLLLAPLLLLLGACGESPPPLPLTAAEATTLRTPTAFVTYLGQSDASAAVCDMQARGPHVLRLDAPTRGAFVDGLTSGQIPPRLWHDCAAALLKSAPPEDAASLIDDVGKGYRSLVLDSAFEQSLDMQYRVAQMQLLYLDRDNQIRDPHPAFRELIADLRDALAKKALGPVGTQLGSDLVNAIDAENGLWDGRPVDVALLDRLAASNDEATLHLLMERLPNSDLREEAKRRVVRIHIARSPLPEVHADEAGVEARLMTMGTNTIAVEKTPPTRGWLDMSKAKMSGVLVKEDLTHQTASIYGYRDSTALSVLQDLQLRDVLFMELPGLKTAVTLCGTPGALDPTPCVAAADVKIANPMAYLENNGVFRFNDHLSMSNAAALMAMHDQFTLPVSVGDKTLLTMEWPFHYARPADMDFNTGPRLTIAVDHRDPARYLFTVKNATSSYLAVVEAADIKQFHIISRGTTGVSGADGVAGDTGNSANSACGNGGRGGDGGPGDNGGTGGPGGDIDVEIDCDGAASCADTSSILTGAILSLGGAGGEGGRGGAGGSGGEGGVGHFSSGPSTHGDCPPGSTGADGSRGPDGSTGPSGRPGHVTMHAKGK